MKTDPIAVGKAALKDELVRRLYRRVEAIRASREDMTFQAAFNLLKKREPALFAHIARVEADGERQNAGNAAVREGMQLIRAQAASDIKQTVSEVQQARGLSFVEAWEVAKKENPSLFAGAARIEAGDWGSGVRPLVHASARKPAVRFKPDDGDDRQVYVVMAGSQVVDITLE